MSQRNPAFQEVSDVVRMPFSNGMPSLISGTAADIFKEESSQFEPGPQPVFRTGDIMSNKSNLP